VLPRGDAAPTVLTVVSDVPILVNTAYLSSQCHIEIWANERPEDVKKEGKGKQIVKGKIPVGEK